MRFFIYSTMLTLAALLTAGSSLAQMGPGRALPGNWTMSATTGYGALVVNGNQLSAMCVECHTANPSVHTFKTDIPNNEDEARYRGGHFVRNNLDGTDRPTAAGQLSIEKIDAWNLTGLSKYGNFATKLSVTGVTGDMICESCHNTVLNRGNNMLLGNYDPATGESTFCAGCHFNEAAGPPEHHPMSGHVVGPHQSSPNDPVAAGDHSLNINHHYATISHLRWPIIDITLSDKVKYFSSPFELSCMSCHKPHDAMTATGARMLRRGYGSSTGPIAGKPVNAAYPNQTTDPDYDAVSTLLVRRPSGKAATGLHRQSDMTGGKKLVVNFDPLCASCH